MTFLPLKLSLLLCALTLTLGVSAQGGYDIYDRIPETTFYGYIVDSLTKEPLPSAVISVVSRVDGRGGRIVRNFVSDEKGAFSFRCYLGKQHRMEVASLGYKPYVADLTMDKLEQNLGLIRMSQSTEAIDEVVVKARLQMYKMKGDTILFIPKAVKTMKDDPALEILRHMPGVEVDAGGGIKIMGKQVERTYVNNKLLFGEDPTVALKELDASEIASIEAYDEVDEADAVANGENARKRKALNVVTFKDFTKSYSARAHGEMGTDFHENADGERPVRYLGSGSVNFFSEALQLSASGQSNNLTAPEGRGSRYTSQRQSDANAKVSGDSGQHRYNAGYYYSGGVNAQRSASSSDYFPTDYFTSQRIENTMHREGDSDSHSFSGGYGYTGERTSVSTSLEARLADGSNFEQSTQSIVRDGKAVSAADINSMTHHAPRSFNWSAHASRRFKGGNSITANTRVNLEDNPLRGVRRERRTTDGVETPLEWDTYSPSPENKVTGGVGYTLDFKKAGNLTFRSDVSYNGSTERILYTDLLTGERDLARSEDAFDKTVEWSIGPKYELRRDDNSLFATLNYQLENREYDNIKADKTDRRNFHFLTGNIRYEYNRPKKNFSVQFGNNYRRVNVRNFSSRINDTNPLYVSTGNRSLVPEKDYTLMFDTDFLGEKASYGFGAQISAEVDPITHRRTFFKEATTLPEYDDYLMPAGSTLSTPENGASYLQISASANYKVRITPLRLFLDFDATYFFSNPEETQYDRTERTARHEVWLNTQITTNFSSKFRLRANNRARLTFMNRFGNSSRDFRDELTAGMEWDILKNLNLKADYTGIYTSSSAAIPSQTTHLLNLSLGYRVLKERGRIAFNAYDVLNDYAPIRIRQSLESISRSVEYVSANYFTLSFEYKFNNRSTKQ